MSKHPFEHICIFEDLETKHFYPINFNRAFFSVQCGLSSLFERVYQKFNHCSFSCVVSPHIASATRIRYPKLLVNQLGSKRQCLFFNSRVVLTDALVQQLLNLHPKRNQAIIQNNQVIAMLLQDEKIELIYNLLIQGASNAQLRQAIQKEALLSSKQAIILNNWDDVITKQAEILSYDENSVSLGVVKGSIDPLISLQNEQNIAIASGVKLDNFVHLDASKGPIIIDKHSHIQSFSYIEGPAYIGPNCSIKGARLSGVVIGPCCKIGGEVSQSIFQGYSNKAHEGYIGNSYIGEWVNLAAGTTISNLKFSYAPATYRILDKTFTASSPFLGAIIGDYVKTGIGTLINTGCSVGFGSCLLAGETFKEEIPPFSWGSYNHFSRQNINKFIEASEIMMARRNKSLHIDLKRFFNTLHHQAPQLNHVSL